GLARSAVRGDGLLRLLERRGARDGTGGCRRGATRRHRKGPTKTLQRELLRRSSSVSPLALPARYGHLRRGWSLPPKGCRRVYPPERAAAGHPRIPKEDQRDRSRMTPKKKLESRKSPSRKPWSGRFRSPTDPDVEAFTSSIEVDRRLYLHDIAGSLAHCLTLERAGLLTLREATRLAKGLKQVKREIAGGRFRFAPGQEDIHM